MKSGPEYQREAAHLEQILRIAEAQLRAALQCGEAGRAALAAERREMREQAEQSFGNLWSSDDFENLANLNQLAQPLSVRQTAHEMSLARAQSLQAMLDAPYFARIDVLEAGETEPEQVYIGRATLKDDATHQIYVHDWRSPIAGVFYRFGVGRAHYDAPGGRIECEVLLKRQYEIRQGRLQFYFDADAQVQDEFLRGLLAQNASPRMRAIVETIQRDQDAAIRDMDHELLMVQGVAGSGKTSVALHRAAYLMYEGLSSRVSSADIMILSPNPLFERYIEGVLPELGERGVGSITLERLLQSELPDIAVQARTERFEAQCALAPERRAEFRERMVFKGSPAFQQVLDRFARELPGRWIPFEDVRYGRDVVATRQQLRSRAIREAREGAVPLGAALLRMELSLWNGIHRCRPARMDALRERARHCPSGALEREPLARAYSIWESALLARRIERFTRLDFRALYLALVSDERAFRRLARGLELPSDLPGLLRSTRESLRSGGALPPEDAIAIAYLKRKLMGADVERAHIRHLLVDEAQDYDPLAYALLNLLFPRARLTILGDVNQSIEREVDRSLYRGIGAAMPRRSAALVELNKSFRCTGEILGFSLRLLRPDERIESFNRGGDAPEVIHAPDDRPIVDAVARCGAKGDRSIALIAKTASHARAWHGRLAGLIPDLGLVDAGDEPRGAFVVSLALSKGLEFDAALVLDADDLHYGQPGDARLLYVACTRALHRLFLFYRDAPSPHLGREGEGLA